MSIITHTIGSLEYLTSQELSAPHCFTTRYGGVSTGTQSSLNLACGRGDSPANVAQNIGILAQAIGFDPDKLVLTHQTHSNLVRAVTPMDHITLFHRDYPECDALVTNSLGVTLMIFTADCTPLLFHDPVTGAVGAAHAGWRGTALAIAAKTVEAMVAHYGCQPQDIHAAIGPNIGQCHFETGEDVPQALIAAFGSEAELYIRKQGEKFFPDLKAINAMVLRWCGLTHIDVSSDCTYCQSDRFWSHRVTGGIRGSQGAVIVCKGGSK